MTIRPAASDASTMIPYENASRSPRIANWRGMWPSPARMASRRGKALKLVFAARKSSSAVKIWNR